MADKLTYKGGVDVINASGSMKLVLPKGGGDFHRIPQWWSKKQAVKYVESAVFKVPLDNGGTVRLILPGVTAHMTIDIRHDGNGEFTFPNSGALERAAVVNADSLDLIYEYQFAKISGGAVLKRTVGSLPGGAVSFSDGAGISGTPIVGETITATAANYTGGIGSVTTNLIFQVSDTGSGGWAFLSGNPGTPSGGSATYTIQGGDDTKYIRASYQVTDDNGTTSSNSSSIGPVATTFAQRAAAANFNYTIGINNVGTAELPQIVFTLNGLDGPGLTFNVGDVVLFDFTAVPGIYPFGLYTDSTKTTPYTNGVEINGTQMLLTVAEAGSISYQAANHINMGGDITLLS